MKIIACIKQVPDTETQIRIDSTGLDLEKQGIKYIVNPYDEYAIEEAVRIKERLKDGEVVVITLGPSRAKEALRTCLAIGADRAIHIDDPSFEGQDAHALSHALADVIRKESPQIILLGKQAVDDDVAQVGSMLAEILDLPFVSVVTELEISPDRKKAVCRREIEGATEEIECNLPAVFSAQKGLNEPRYPALPAIMKAKKKEIRDLDAERIGMSSEQVKGMSRTKVVKLEYPPKRSQGSLVPGETAADLARNLIRLLREEAKVI